MKVFVAGELIVVAVLVVVLVVGEVVAAQLLGFPPVEFFASSVRPLV